VLLLVLDKIQKHGRARVPLLQTSCTCRND
jgi:hypothetical protein